MGGGYIIKRKCAVKLFEHVVSTVIEDFYGGCSDNEKRLFAMCVQGPKTLFCSEVQLPLELLVQQDCFDDCLRKFL